MSERSPFARLPEREASRETRQTDHAVLPVMRMRESETMSHVTFHMSHSREANWTANVHKGEPCKLVWDKNAMGGDDFPPPPPRPQRQICLSTKPKPAVVSRTLDPFWASCSQAPAWQLAWDQRHLSPHFSLLVACSLAYRNAGYALRRGRTTGSPSGRLLGTAHKESDPVWNAFLVGDQEWQPSFVLKHWKT